MKGLLFTHSHTAHRVINFQRENSISELASGRLMLCTWSLMQKTWKMPFLEQFSTSGLLPRWWMIKKTFVHIAFEKRVRAPGKRKVNCGMQHVVRIWLIIQHESFWCFGLLTENSSEQSFRGQLKSFGSDFFYQSGSLQYWYRIK